MSQSVRVLNEYTVLCTYGDVEDFLVDYSANIAIGGMFIKTDSPLDVGTRFRLRMQLPGFPRSFDTTAEVRWVLPPEEAGPLAPGMGIVFDDLREADRKAVERMLADWE